MSDWLIVCAVSNRIENCCVIRGASHEELCDYIRKNPKKFEFIFRRLAEVPLNELEDESILYRKFVGMIDTTLYKGQRFDYLVQKIGTDTFNSMTLKKQKNTCQRLINKDINELGDDISELYTAIGRKQVYAKIKEIMANYTDEELIKSLSIEIDFSDESLIVKVLDLDDNNIIDPENLGVDSNGRSWLFYEISEDGFLPGSCRLVIARTSEEVGKYYKKYFNDFLPLLYPFRDLKEESGQLCLEIQNYLTENDYYEILMFWGQESDDNDIKLINEKKKLIKSIKKIITKYADDQIIDSINAIYSESATNFFGIKKISGKNIIFI